MLEKHGSIIQNNYNYNSIIKWFLSIATIFSMVNKRTTDQELLLVHVTCQASIDYNYTFLYFITKVDLTNDCIY